MGYQQRKELIANLEQVRGSKVISYILSDRDTFPPGIPGYSSNLTNQPQLLFANQLRSIGKVSQIDLFLYTRGGAVDSVWPLVCLLREYCEKFTVLVPFRAHSGGTLICLGADEVVLTEIAELSPIDPTTGNQFNPTDPANPQNRFGISVEDVAAYFELAEKRAGITQEPHKLEIFRQLTGQVHPLALGNVQRVYNQIRRLASSLLVLHLDEKTQAAEIEAIQKALTEAFFSHVHAVTRKEAIPLLGPWVRPPTEKEDQAIRDLFNSYIETLELTSTFNLPAYMGDEPSRDLSAVGAFIESTELSYILRTRLRVLQRPNIPPNIQVQVPAGTPLPLIPWVVRAYEYGVQKIGWEVNHEQA